MPWTIEDVDKHKKGLSAKQKRQWVKIANSALQACMSKGGNDSSCAASAIRQANGSVGNNAEKGKDYSVFTYTSVEGYTVQEKTYQGKKHLVVPVTMMVEGVHHGSHGPLLHLITDLGKIPAAWNGIPVVIDHPEEDGQNISANEPEIIEERAVGIVFHTKVKEKKLQAEAWLDENKLRQVSSDVLAAVKASEPVEVSVGVFTDEEEEEGEFEGEEYSAIARNHRPDHLALLPGGVGACSVEDGCGIRANNNNDKKKGVRNEMIRTDKLVRVFQALKEQGYAMLDIIDNTSEGLMERLEAVRRKIDSLDSNDSYHFVHEVYDEYVVYESRLRVGESKIYKQAYTFNSGVVELTGDPVEVHKKVEYIANNSSAPKFVRTKPIKNKEVKMANNKCPECVKKINALIANKESGWSEDDRDLLDTFTETQLDRLIPKIVEKEKKVEVNTLTDAQKAALAFGERQLKIRREHMTKVIQANATKETWPDEVLKDMSEDQLERVFNSVKKEEDIVDYSLSGGHTNNIEDNSDEGPAEPMYPGGIKIAEEKK